MIKGKTKSGIDFEINERIKEDARFLKYATQMQGNDPNKALDAMYKMFNLVFGTEEAAEKFMDDIAQKNDGICDQETLVNEFKEIIESTEIKKS